MLAYYWDPEKKEVRIVEDSYDAERDCFMVDGMCVTPHARYGVINSKTLEWVHVPFEDFPAEFKLELLLMGVK